jgi:hypothetical protein
MSEGEGFGLVEEKTRDPKSGINPAHKRPLENVLGYLGGFNCVSVPLFFTFQELSLGRAFGDLWPRPGVYFLEILVIGLATTYFIMVNKDSQPTRWNGLPWISSGILLTLVIMGIFGFGLFLLPAMTFYLAAGILGDRRQAGNWPTHTMLFFLAAMAQAVAVYLLLILFR